MGGGDFATLTIEGVTEFRKALRTGTDRSGEAALSSSTLVHQLGHCKAFIAWLSMQEQVKKLAPDLASYFTPSRGDLALTRNVAPRTWPSEADLVRAIEEMPSKSIIDRRNRAIIALMVLSGARDDAAISLRRKHLDLAGRIIHQDAREVRVKFSKSQLTAFFPVAETFLEILTEWVDEVDAMGLKEEDALFPKQNDLGAIILSRRLNRAPLMPYASAAIIRETFGSAMRRTGLPPHSPHSIRHMLTELAQSRTRSLMEEKAWSRNLGHASVSTTRIAYANLSQDEQLRIINGLGERSFLPNEDKDILLAFYEQRLENGSEAHSRALQLISARKIRIE